MGNDIVRELRRSLARQERHFPYIFDSMKAIESKYILISQWKTEYSRYMERVYCYELYHQLRLHQRKSGIAYVWYGEPEKGGNPDFKGKRYKPDLILHVPGMRDNLLAIEVKRIDARRKAIIEDLRKLSEYIHEHGYAEGLLIIFGDAERKDLPDIRKDAISTYGRSIEKVKILLHRSSGAIERIDLNPNRGSLDEVESGDVDG